jgi:hypothetical protein
VSFCRSPPPKAGVVRCTSVRPVAARCESVSSSGRVARRRFECDRLGVQFDISCFTPRSPSMSAAAGCAELSI